ncbi:MAG: aminomethyltransferase, partial [Flavobacterium sp.]
AIGIVTSGTMSPSMNKGIGLGYVKVANSAVNNDIFIRIRKNDVLAKVVKLPFYKK